MKTKPTRPQHDASDRASVICPTVENILTDLDGLSLDDARVALRWVCELRGISVTNLNMGRGD